MGGCVAVQEETYEDMETDFTGPETRGSFKPLINPIGAYKFVVTQPYELHWRHKRVSVPRGFLTDGSTGGPEWGSSWVYHDFLYSTHSFDDGTHCSRDEADKIMETVLLKDGLLSYRAAFLASLRAAPDIFKKAWSQSGEAGPKVLARLIESEKAIIP